MGFDGSGQRTAAFFAGAIAIALVLAGCPQPGGNGDGVSAFKLGSVLPLTGDLSPFGPSAEKAVQLAVKKVNDNGGVNDQDVVHISEDSETSQQAAPQAVNRLINVEGIHGLVGAMGSGVSLSFIDSVAQAGLPMVSPSNTAPTFSTTYGTEGGDNGWYFRTVPADTLQGKVMNQLVQNSGHSKVSILAINNDYGVGFGDIFQQEFQTDDPAETGGRDIEAYVKYDPQATTFGSTVDEVAGANDPTVDPEAVVVIGYPDTVSAVMDTAFSKGYAGPNGSLDWFFSEGLKDESGFVDEVNTTDEGEYILAGYRGTTPEFDIGQEFASDFQSEYGEEPALFSDNTFDAAMLQMLAAEQCDCVKGEPLKQAMFQVQNDGTEVSTVSEALTMIRNGEDIDWDGAAGEMSWDGIGDVTTGTYSTWKVDDSGRIVTIESGIQVE